MRGRLSRLWASPPVRPLREMLRLYFEKDIPCRAAALAYFLILSFFPALICVNGLVGTLELDMRSLLPALGEMVPREALTLLEDYVGYISSNRSSAMFFAGLVMTLFSASAAFRGLMDAMEEIWGRPGYAGVGKVVASVLFSVLFLFTVYLSLAVLLTGEWLFDLLGGLLGLPLARQLWSWQWLRFLLLFCLVFLFVGLVYRLAAPREGPRPPVLPGALAASAALVVASALFSWFIGLSSRYSLVYGSLASLVVLLVWLYLCGNLLLAGSLFNAVYSRPGRGGG